MSQHEMKGGQARIFFQKSTNFFQKNRQIFIFLGTLGLQQSHLSATEMWRIILRTFWCIIWLSMIIILDIINNFVI